MQQHRGHGLPKTRQLYGHVLEDDAVVVVKPSNDGRETNPSHAIDIGAESGDLRCAAGADQPSPNAISEAGS